MTRVAGVHGVGFDDCGVVGLLTMAISTMILIIHVQDVGDQGLGLHLLPVQLLHLLLDLDCLDGDLLSWPANISFNIVAGGGCVAHDGKKLISKNQ